MNRWAQQAGDQHRPASILFGAAMSTWPAISEDVDILARTAWAEARSHGLDGMAAVLNVIHNRVEQPSWWGRTWRGVCKARWQFSCWNPSDVQRSKILTVDLADPHFHDAVMLASALVAGKLRDRTNGADHYYAEYIPAPEWAKGRKPVLTIGPAGQRHHFFRIGPGGE